MTQTSSEHTKVAFTVGKSVGNSVVRHKVTRQLRHAITPLINNFPAGSHVVVRALPGASQATFTQLSENLEFATSKVNAS